MKTLGQFGLEFFESRQISPETAASAVTRHALLVTRSLLLEMMHHTVTARASTRQSPGFVGPVVQARARPVLAC